MPDPATQAAFALIESTPAQDLTDELAKTLERAGLDGVLADLNRSGEAATAPGPACGAGFTWDKQDRDSTAWFPQGITTCADATGQPTRDGRRVMLISWYAKLVRGRSQGARITVVDHTDPERPRYRHVLLVQPVRRLWRVDLRPVRSHAGGMAWYGDRLYVAATRSGLRVFLLDDIMRVPQRRPRWRWGRDRSADIGLGRGWSGRYRAYGYRYVLPQSSAYVPSEHSGATGLRFSFMSLDRTGTEHQLITGEYAREGSPARLARWGLDPVSYGLRRDAGRGAVPLEVLDDQMQRMQGATMVDGRWFITSSAGEGNPGGLWVGMTGSVRHHPGVLPTGPEDVTYYAPDEVLWTLTEWPGRRWVYPVDVRGWV